MRSRFSRRRSAGRGGQMTRREPARCAAPTCISAAERHRERARPRHRRVPWGERRLVAVVSASLAVRHAEIRATCFEETAFWSISVHASGSMDKNRAFYAVSAGELSTGMESGVTAVGVCPVSANRGAARQAASRKALPDRRDAANCGRALPGAPDRRSIMLEPGGHD